MTRWLRLILFLGLLVPMTVLAAPFQLLAVRTGMPLRRWLPVCWHRIAARIIGLRTRVHGKPAIHDHAGVLIAANHVSWLDIIALGAAAPVSFIAKDEVARWPGISILAKLQETVFVERHRRGKVGEQAARIRDRLERGDAVVLFPEGTTSDGNFLLPFKSALFGAVGVTPHAAGKSPHVQPVAIVYTHLHGMPMGRYDRPVAAWPGDVGLAPHLWRVLGEGAIDVSIVFGEAFPASELPDRKALAAACEAAIREMVSGVLRGRTPLPSGVKTG
ncbi:lysophospholipid acyltransferase family protein [Oricola thermophila]|uniref:1-acyl-sn-glycerol-3-phosphate acyltransferase n=1 Tax=Oricola thermophila TaxID=2742145 RepID=A0A6N1VKT3_9HYPH|nr:lysophospholipid acyltransferase family protein [Oricola thermophila]QKV19547.1 1-acyl-sn-glycerol-3-phosphate acyltransferase [Oricola thermophila]